MTRGVRWYTEAELPGFAERLTLVRQQRGLHQGQVPGFTRGQVVTWENGRSLPRPGDILKLADIFGVSLEWLMRGDAAVRVGQVGPDAGEEPPPGVGALAAAEGIRPALLAALIRALKESPLIEREYRDTVDEETAAAAAAMLALIEARSRSLAARALLRSVARNLQGLFEDGWAEIPSDLASIDEAAAHVGVSRHSIDAAIRAGRLPGYRQPDGAWRVSLREVRLAVGSPGLVRRFVSKLPPLGDAPSPAAAPEPPPPGATEAPTETGPAAEAAPRAALSPASQPAPRPAARRLRVADIASDPAVPLEQEHPGLRDDLRVWAVWADAEVDRETYRRNIAAPPEDAPPPFDFEHYDQWETVLSAGHGLQWWEYPEEHRRLAFARFLGRMAEMYRDEPDKRARMWEASLQSYGPLGERPNPAQIEERRRYRSEAARRLDEEQARETASAAEEERARQAAAEPSPRRGGRPRGPRKA